MRTTKDLDAWVSGFDGWAADQSVFRVVLLLSASASAMPPSGPSLLKRSLRTRQTEGCEGASAASRGAPLARHAHPSALGSRAGLTARTGAW